MTRPILIAGFALLSVAAAAAFVLAPHPDRTTHPDRSAPKTSPATNLATRPMKRTVDPVDTLVAQLHRRFSDTRDADFGFSRISRPLARMHYGVTMDRNDLLYERPGRADDEGDMAMNPDLVRRTRSGEFEMKTERGTWIPAERARDQMRPENATERKAIGDLAKGGREIAIYTFGAFERGHTERAHGPAYLRQLGPEAPPSEKLKRVADTAWSGGRPNLPGFRLRVERIFAEFSCVKCHNDLGGLSEDGQPRKTTYKKGSPLGLIVVAERI